MGLQIVLLPMQQRATLPAPKSIHDSHGRETAECPLWQEEPPAYPQPALPFVGRVMELHFPEGYAVDHTILQLFSDLLCGALHGKTRYTVR